MREENAEKLGEENKDRPYRSMLMCSLSLNGKTPIHAEPRQDNLTSVMNTMMVVFGGLVVALMGLVFWDRRTLIEKAKDEAVKKIETNSRLINALRELAKTDKRLADVMKSFGLL